MRITEKMLSEKLDRLNRVFGTDIKLRYDREISKYSLFEQREHGTIFDSFLCSAESRFTSREAFYFIDGALRSEIFLRINKRFK